MGAEGEAAVLEGGLRHGLDVIGDGSTATPR
jgi:hypothetical protein